MESLEKPLAGAPLPYRFEKLDIVCTKCGIDYPPALCICMVRGNHIPELRCRECIRMDPAIERNMPFDMESWNTIQAAINERNMAERIAKGPLLIDHLVLMSRVLSKEAELANDQDANVFASWKVGGQDFYIYAKVPDDDLPKYKKGGGEN